MELHLLVEELIASWAQIQCLRGTARAGGRWTPEMLVVHEEAVKRIDKLIAEDLPKEWAAWKGSI